MQQYSVSIVYINRLSDSIDTRLRVYLPFAIDAHHALGLTIEYFSEEMKGFDIHLKASIAIPEPERKTPSEHVTVTQDLYRDL